MSELTSPDGGSTRSPSKKRRATRHEQLHQMLCRKSGVKIDQIQKAFNWQPHTARAAISAQRKAGQTVVRANGANGSVYRIVTDGDEA